MPYEIRFDMPPAGHVLQAVRAGEDASVQFREFTSSEDGQHFIQRLEGFPNEIIQKLAGKCDVRPSTVDHLLAIIRKDCSATVYVNDLPLSIAVRPARPLKAGEPVFKSDIVDVSEVRIGDIDIPNDCGVVFVFSTGWRKGLFYDFGPLQDEASPRTYECLQIFSQCYAHVMFQERFAITEEQWESLLGSKWFLFNGLSNETIQKMIGQLNAGWDLDELTDDIVEDVKSRTDWFLSGWEKHPAFQSHLDVLRRAMDHFQNGDYLSCTAMLYPRLEGVMRSNVLEAGGSSMRQDSLAQAAVASKLPNPKCLLLPHRFQRFLRDVYFASFNSQDEDIDVSRHSVSHGVASSENFDAKAAVIGILVANQLFYCCEADEVEAEE